MAGDPEKREEREEKEDEAVEDVIEFFEATGDEDTPTSDADAPAP